MSATASDDKVRPIFPNAEAAKALVRDSAVASGVMSMEEVDTLLTMDWTDEAAFRAHVILNLVGMRKNYEQAMEFQRQGREEMFAAAKAQRDAGEQLQAKTQELVQTIEDLKSGKRPIAVPAGAISQLKDH
jgi:hypothetical protein